MSIKDMLKNNNDFERYRDCYIYFFVNTAYISTFIDYAHMRKRNDEVRELLISLGSEPVIRQFPFGRLNLPNSYTCKREKKSYRQLRHITLAISGNFSIMYWWTRILTSAYMLLHPYTNLSEKD